MVDVALIPPYCRVRDMRKRKLQMFLPTCLRSMPRHYQEYLHKLDTHIILDNGMFEENKPVLTEELLSLAGRFSVDEIVLPDVRDDGPATYEAIKQFRVDYDNNDLGVSNISFMYVVQGATEEERKNSIDVLADIAPYGTGTVLGFPRFLTREHAAARITLMEYAVSKYGTRFKLHMLGLSREWPGELLRATRQFGSHLRGVDTSAPYTYAFHGAQLQSDWDAKGERPHHYFAQPGNRFQDKLVKYNISVLEAWAQGLNHMPYQE